MCNLGKIKARVFDKMKDLKKKKKNTTILFLKHGGGDFFFLLCFVHEHKNSPSFALLTNRKREGKEKI